MTSANEIHATDILKLPSQMEEAAQLLHTQKLQVDWTDELDPTLKAGPPSQLHLQEKFQEECSLFKRSPLSKCSH